MKRKTNLFYTEGIDSKFITFSNYTESLTGNFLSTDTKLYPSRFIAIYIKGLNEDTKPAFIKYLADYYESKLAVLRDYYSENRQDIEKDVNPLGYLLDALLRIKEISEDGVDYASSIVENGAVEFKYISEITEQDYNGTFADTICCIDLRSFTNISNVEKNNDVDDLVVTFEQPENLYGWGDKIPIDYENEQSIPDRIGGFTMEELEEILNESDDSNYDETETTISIKEKVININEIEIENPEYDDSYDDSYADETISVFDYINLMSDEKPAEDILSELLNPLSETSNKLIDAVNVAMEKQESSEHPQVILYGNEMYGIDDSYNTSNVVLYVYDGASINTIELNKNYEYNITSEVKTLTLEKINSIENKSIKFNAIIPLYDIVNINYKSNFNTIEHEIDNGTGMIDLTPSPNNNMYIKNVPLGMWLYTTGDINDDNSTVINLYYDMESGFSQTWSLTISSQFKPFPYSDKMPSELITNSSTNAYSTFAQVLASQSSMMDKFMSVIEEINDLKSHVRNIESQLNNLGTSYNIDNIHREFNNFEIEMNNNFNTLKNDVLNQISYLKWHTTV